MPFTPALTAEQQEYAAREYRKGRSSRDIGEELKVSKHTVLRCVARRQVTKRGRGAPGPMPRDVDPADALRLRRLYDAVPGGPKRRRTSGQAGRVLAVELQRLNVGGLPLEALAGALGMSTAGVHHIIRLHCTPG